MNKEAWQDVDEVLHALWLNTTSEKAAKKELEIVIQAAFTPTWIDWGDIDTFHSPVPEGTIVEVQNRRGDYRCDYSERISWAGDLGPGTVIRYRILGSRGDS